MLTKSQDHALKLAQSWIAAEGRLLKLGGPAGSGKSYLIPLIADLVGIENCLLMTPTGKAANNLQKAGLNAQTIHSTIYKVLDEEEESENSDVDSEEEDAVIPEFNYESRAPRFTLRDPSSFENVRMFIVDEASMVGGSLLRDILSFGVPVLLVGDPNQLAPVNDISVYNTCDFYLEEIVRQAQDSPIIWLSQQALAGKLSQGVFGSCMVRPGSPAENELLYADVVLTDTNARREELNSQIRRLTFSGMPASWVVEGDKIICRTNDPKVVSSYGFALTNGTQGKVREIMHRNKLKAELLMDNPELGEYHLTGTPLPLKFPPKKRPPTIEMGYALTVHLSQGSEWDNVIYDLSMHPTKRALYTAITRAKQSLLITL